MARIRAVGELAHDAAPRAVRWTPARALQGAVLRLTGYAEPREGPVTYVELPATFVAVVLDAGGPYRVRAATDPETCAATLRSFVGGLTVAPVVVDSDGDALVTQVDLAPLAASRFLGVPMHELAAEPAVPLADVLGHGVDRLEEQLAEAPDWDARRRLTEAFVARRLAAAEPVPADVAYAWRRLAETGGRIRIGALAAELGCSRKHLRSRFLQHVGLAPKPAAKLVRFERALALLRSGVGGAEVAFRCGYADQPHLVNEFRGFAGRPPVRFLQDEAAQTA